MNQFEYCICPTFDATYQMYQVTRHLLRQISSRWHSSERLFFDSGTTTISISRSNQLPRGFTEVFAWYASDHRGTPRDSATTGLNKILRFVRDLNTSGFDAIVRDSTTAVLPGTGSNQDGTKTEFLVLYLATAVLHGIFFVLWTRLNLVTRSIFLFLSQHCCVRRRRRWHYTCRFLWDPAPKVSPRSSWGGPIREPFSPIRSYLSITRTSTKYIEIE